MSYFAVQPYEQTLEWLRIFDSGDEVEFRLTYSGPLPADTKHGVCAIKHEIRRALQPQLRDLCERTPSLHLLALRILGHDWPPVPPNAPSDLRADVRSISPSFSAIGDKLRFGGFQFVPLVIGGIHAVCHVDILFLRREKPGDLLSKPKDEYGGDLDNRLKIFLDALRVPRELSEIPAGAEPSNEEKPFFCLLEDDSLITRFSVESDTLLGPAKDESKTGVSLIAKVTTKLTRLNIGNLDFAV